jgi:thiol-disulfide isomerase/thioredoxin
MSRKRIFTSTIALVILIPLLYFGFKRFFKAPSIALTTLHTVDLTNNPVALSSYNKNLVVSIWATWCGTCINEMPELVAIKQQLNAAEWEVILISDEEMEKINRFVQIKQYDLTFLKATNVFSDIGITRYPTTYIFDRNGTLKFQRNGKLALFKGEFLSVIEKMKP